MGEEMVYTVLIRNTATGEERTYASDIPWHDSVFWWRSGNMACDCNRRLCFREAGGEPDLADGANPCGAGGYVVPYVTLADGRRVWIDEEDEDAELPIVVVAPRHGEVSNG